MQERVINILISPNVYALHFVNSYWLKRSVLSNDAKYYSSLSILFILNASVILLVSDHFENINWRFFLFVVTAYHLLIAIIFNKRILNNIKDYNLTTLSKYYFLFIGYLFIGTISLIFIGFK